MQSPTIVLLYVVCSALLLVSSAAILVRSPRARLNRAFALTALALLGWVGTLFFFDQLYVVSPTLLWLGRTNFAAAAIAASATFCFVLALAGEPVPRRKGWLIAGETVLLAALTTFTPAVDAAERISVGNHHVTTYGLLFPLYASHILVYFGAALVRAFQARRTVYEPSQRDQLLLVGVGTLLTGGIALVTNIVLPFVYGNFAFADWGPISSLFFVLAVAYAVARHRLFDIRLLVRRTLIYGLLLSLALAAYSSFIAIVTDKLTGDSANSVSRFGVLVIAFSFDPIRRFFEHRIDKMLFRDKAE